MTYSAMCLALMIVLPFFTGNKQDLGNALCLMHIPALLCGFLCGWYWGAAVGFIGPLFRTLLIGKPPFPAVAVPMAFELCTYGFIAGLLYKLLPKKLPFIYVSLISAMLGGRIVGGIAKFVVMTGILGKEYLFGTFLTSYFVVSLPGMAIQIVLIPILVFALSRAGLVPAEKK